MTRFLCVGDLHLGAGSDYGREPGDRLRDQEAVWAAALELADEHDVDAVLFAGDAFHRRRPTPAEMIAFQRPLQQFTAEHDIDILAISGNHDCEAADLPTALDVFGREIDLHVKPGIWQTRGCAVATLPWSPVSRLVAARDGGDRDDLNLEAAELLLAAARGLRAEITSGPAVLMLHWSISGASTPTGVLTDDFREVVLPIEGLEALGFDAIVAGHIHKPQQLDIEPEVGYAQPIFYTGSPAPVDFGEAASDHGAWLLDTAEFGSSTGASAVFLPIESRPFTTLWWDQDDDPSVYGEILNGDWSTREQAVDAVVRVRYTASEEAARSIDHIALRRSLYDAGAHKVYAIQPDIIRAERARVAGVSEDLAPLSALDLWLEAEKLDEPERVWLRELTVRYLEAA